MGAATDGAEIVRLSKEHAELKPVADAVMALQKAREEQPELEEMAASGDPEMEAMARDELDALKERLPELERREGREGVIASAMDTAQAALSAGKAAVQGATHAARTGDHRRGQQPGVWRHSADFRSL